MNDGCRRIVAMAMVAGSDPGFQQASAAAALSICNTMSSSARRATTRFYVEMKPDETTFVSWRKLVKDSHRDTNPNGSSPSPTPFGAHPALEARIAPEVVIQKDPLPPPANRFNSVIEKIERIYQGEDSSDGNDALNGFPDDDQYDTDDSFIDDRDLNEYFSVDEEKLKHDGFFVNRGKLERTEAVAPPLSVPKKRKRRDIKKLGNDSNEGTAKQQLNTGIMLKSAILSNIPSTVGSSDSSDKDLFALASSSKGVQIKKKGCLDFTVRHAGGKSSKINHHGEIQANNHADRVKILAKGQTDHRMFSKCNSAERPKEQTCTIIKTEFQSMKDVDSTGFLKRSCKELESKDTGVLVSNKVKAAPKTSQDEDSKELVTIACRMQLGNSSLSSTVGKDVSPIRSKSTALQRALQDLERGVAQLCPPLLTQSEAEQGKRNRLPQDIKQKLAKIARLAVKQGKHPDEFIDRLMGILGHVMQEKTLKKNLNEMIEVGKSAMQEKEGRLQDIKWEVTQMVKSRVHSLQGQPQDVDPRDLSSDDFQTQGASAEKPSTDGRYQWDSATEDKICDLYEQYIEGMDEHKGPQIRKLYGELAELWPDGWMDNNGIKHAVQRAKDRKKKLIKANIAREEIKKRQRLGYKQVETEMERFPLLDLNLPGIDNSSYEKAKCSGVHTSSESNLGGQMSLSSVAKNHQAIKISHAKSFASIEKMSKVEGHPLLKKKVKRKLEKSVMDALGNASHGKAMTFEAPYWKMGIQPLVALPAQPLHHGHFLHSETAAAEHNTS